MLVKEPEFEVPLGGADMPAPTLVMFIFDGRVNRGQACRVSECFKRQTFQLQLLGI